MKKTDKKLDKLSELVKLFDGNLDLALFYLAWIKNGLNASNAYRELHPNVDDNSARVLGSKSLSRINKTVIMAAYGLDPHLYFAQLRMGLAADKRDQNSGQVSPDHRTRDLYHTKLGKLLGLEADNATLQMNQQNITIHPLPIMGGSSLDPNNVTDADIVDVQNVDLKGVTDDELAGEIARRKRSR